MVTTSCVWVCAIGYLLVAEANGPLLERLDAPRRTYVVMALLALVLTGLALVTCAMLGAHWVRRLARHNPADRRATSASGHAIPNRRLSSSLEKVIPPLKTGDTMHMDVSTKDTKVDPPSSS